MGTSQSLPEKVLSAVQRNDVCSLQALLSNLNLSGANNSAARTAVLEYHDKDGRTPLLVAAAKNHYQILQQLIQLGADVNYVNPSRYSAGSALHEAAARRYEGTVELLLAAGASPFTANAAGRTALDEAVLSGHTGVVRAIEKYAEFSGVVAFKTQTMGGLSSKYKARWAVLMPYFPFGHGREGSSANQAQGRSSMDVLKPRRCLWLYKDKSSASPRCRLWVDAAATVLTNGPAGTEGTLRLHTSHGEPIGDLAASFSHGYCVAFRPVDLTPNATSAFHKLVVLLNGSSIPGTQPLQQAVSAMLADPPPVMPYPAAGSLASIPSAILQPLQLMPLPAMQPNTAQTTSSSWSCYTGMLPVAAHRGAAGTSSASPPPSQQVNTSALLVTPPSSYGGQSLMFPVTAGHCPEVSPLTLHNQRQLLATAARTMPSSTHVQSAQDDVPDVSEPGLGGQVISDRVLNSMVALPGESDEVFALRLASAISATFGDHSHLPLYPQKHFRAEAPSFSRPAVQISSHPWQQRLSSTGNKNPNLVYTHSDPRNIPGTYSPSWHVGGGKRVSFGQSQVRPAVVPLEDLEMNTMNALTIDSRTSGCENISLTAHVPTSSCGSQDMEPSAFTASPTSVAPRQPVLVEPEPECVICLNAPKEVGFLHGNSVHCCVCRECSRSINVGALCPLCRQPVERVLGVY
nr:hypothetical protein [Volvox reticuliferus]